MSAHRFLRLSPAAMLAAGLATMGTSGTPGSAHAQAYPSKPIRFIIPYPPGGPRDIQARLLAPRLNEAWGQPIVIDNRAGASGMIGMELAARAHPDGHTVVMISASYTTAPSLYAKLPYDTFGDFMAVAPLTSGPGLLVVNNALPVKSVKELIAYAKSRPGQLNFGSAGNGVPSHLSMELFKLMTGTELAHVPYKGMAAALNDVISGQIQVSLPTIPGGLPHAQAGRVRALGVSGPRRSPAAPEIPTIAEAGVPGYESTNWYGIAVPARTPRAVVAKLNAEIGRIVMLPDVKAKLLTIGMESETSTPEQFEAFLRNEVAKWSKVIKATGLKVE
jgi:tripartite-type tricarboxylate transporter receptor subunit TctC